MARQHALGFHSITDEVARELSVDGTVPDWLSGSLVRNGPGAFELGGRSVDHWFDGLAMLHRYTFDDGVTYRNRFLRTEAYAAARAGEFDGGFATGETTLRQRLKSFVLDDPYDNANVIAERVGERYLALTETPRWVAFDPETLETRGHVRYDGPEPSGRLACAHMNRDPATDEMVNFEVAFGPTSQYHVYAMSTPTERDHVGSVSVEEPAYMHSFALTPNYVVLTEFPFVVDPMAFLRPGRQGPFVDNFEWKPGRGTRFLVLDRASGDLVAEPRTEPFFGFHHANAYEDGDELVLDLETVPDPSAIDSLYLDGLRSGDLDALGGRLERFRVDLGSSAVDRTELYRGTALPTVSPARWCREHRYVYAQGTDLPVTEWPGSVVKIDAETGDAATFGDPDDHYSEPIFVPRPDGTREDDGVVLVVALDDDAERSDLVVLDGESLSELARARLPHAVPFDFHGRFFPELT
ncbi:beta-carotene 15,15'-monooxygenase [halophilic archaeon]|nr:beta-carotene 15,15'-monooxygenase [halophilic archaeon]